MERNDNYMCGIVGVTGNPNAVQILVHGLRKLQYRGYDSAGIYVNDEQGQDWCIKRTGDIQHLDKAITPNVKGLSGIGHTRWATNGKVSINNAHPQFSQDNRFYLVHNGVVENYKELAKKYLQGVKFTSDTDTEVIVQLIDHFVVNNHMSDIEAFKRTIKLLGNTQYALVLIDREHPKTLLLAKRKNPLLIGVGKNCNVVCSDSLAMLNVTHNFMALKDGEIAKVMPQSIHIQNNKGQVVHRKPFHVNLDDNNIGKDGYPFYMAKEINQQPSIMRKLSDIYFNDNGQPQINNKLVQELNKANHIYIVGAGTSYHAGLVGTQIFEKLTKTECTAHDSSEFAYAHPLLSSKPFFIFLTQSGETADSRVVLDEANKHNYPTLTITNVPHSTLDRSAKFTLYLHCGAEISVASTKAYTSQIAVEAILAKALGDYKNNAKAKKFNLKDELREVASGMQQLINRRNAYQVIAKQYLVPSHDAFYIGRQIDYDTAIEASLKLKEISYVHADGFAAGELKHGTIALISRGTPVIAIITDPDTAELTRSNLDETTSRGAQTFTIVSHKLAQNGDTIILPNVNSLLMPLLSIIPAQLLAYYTSLDKGLDVDHPRNLAKSVTVE